MDHDIDEPNEHHSFWSGYLLAGLLSTILWLGIVHVLFLFFPSFG